MDNTTTKSRKTWYVIITVMLVLFLDQWLKVYIKTNFQLAETHAIFGNWFELHFVENPGMAYGLAFGGKWGKIALTSFRLIASGLIIYYIRNLIREGAKTALIVLVSLVLAGALGNIIDSIFYGVLFSASNHQIASFMPRNGGYATWFMGNVVDMLHFPLIDTFWPDWVPFVGGERLQFFRPVFNIADAAISMGVIIILIFRKKLFHDLQEQPEVTSAEEANDLPLSEEA